MPRASAGFVAHPAPSTQNPVRLQADPRSPHISDSQATLESDEKGNPLIIPFVQSTTMYWVKIPIPASFDRIATINPS